MKQKKKKIGFTLVEVLAVLVILGAVALIAYPNIMKQLEVAKEKTYQVQLDDLEKAAASFALKRASLLPVKDGEQMTILLRDLKKDGLVDKDLTNAKTKKRFPEDMEIVITRVGQKYKYEVLDNTGTVTDDTDMNEPMILLKGLSFEYVEINTPYEEKGVIALDKSGNTVPSDKIVTTPTSIDTSILHKEYKITYKVTLEGKTYSIDRKVKVRDTTPPDLTIPKNTSMAPTTAIFDMMKGVSATDNSKEKITVKASGNVVTTVPGVYVITYTASDSSGNTRTKKRTITIYNSVCPLLRIEGTQPSNSPTNKDVKLTAKFVANEKEADEYDLQWQKLVNGVWTDIEGATKNTYTVKEEVHTSYRVVYKYEACKNETNEWNVFIDRQAPTCTILIDGTKGNGDWYKSKNITLTLDKKDVGSGIEAYGLTTSGTPTYNSTSSVSQGDTNGLTYHGYVRDRAGNTGKCSVSVKVDKTAPSCSIGASGTEGDNGWFKSIVSLGLSYTDGSGSGIGKYGMSTSTTPTYNSTKSVNQDNTTGTTWRGYLEDVAGNTATCSRTVKVDRTAPTCTVTFSGTTGNNGWYKEKDATVTLNKSDSGGSELATHGLTTSTTATYNNSTSATQSDTSGTTWRGYVKDKAGNTGSCSASVKVDKIAPSCSIGASGTEGDNGWFKSVVSLGLSYTDGSGSGFGRYGMSTSTTPTYNSTKSVNQDNTTGTTWRGYLEDVAGNTATCSRSVKVDRTAPTCTVTFSGTNGNNGWYKEKDATVTLNKSDSGGSELATHGLTTSTTATYNNSTSATQSDTSGTTWRGYVKDKAGNTGSCSASVKVDKIAPSCSIGASGTEGDNGWFKSVVSLGLSYTDGSGSGFGRYGMSTSTTPTYNSTKSVSQDNTTGTTWRGYVEDAAGNTGSCSRSVKVDRTAPTCTVTFSGTNGNSGWYKAQNATVTLNKSDGGGSELMAHGLTTSTTATYNGSATASQGDTSGTVWRGYVKDKAGNTGSCSASVKVDKTVPSCSIGASGTTGDNGWFKSVVSLGLSRTDGSGSGVGKYGMSTSTAPTYNSTESADQDNTAGTTWYGYVEDVAGNAASCSRTVKVDRTAPTCNVTFSGTTGNSGWYKAQNATVTLNRNDSGGSNVTNYGLTTSTSATYNGSATASQGDTSGTVWRGYVKDAAGNVGSCSASVKVDKTAPSCSIGASGTAGDNGWFKSVVSLGISRTDGSGSGVGKYGMGTSTTPTYNSTASVNQDNTTGTTWYGYVEDVAGNASSCSRTVKVDRTAPTCSIAVTGTAGNNGWYKEKDISLSMSRNDTGGSGLNGYGFTTSTTATYNSSTSASQSDTAGTTWRGYVKDAAGNTGTCSVTVKVDKVNPTCSSSGGSDTWTNGSRTLTGTCADGLSGCAGNVSRPFNSEGSWTNQSPGTVYDKAGNSVTCPANQTVKIDKTAPTCSVTFAGTAGNNGWYKAQNVTVNLGKDDKGGSGLSGHGLTTSTAATYNSSTSASQGDTSGTVWRGYVKDAAGNVGSCSASVKVDKTAPSCSIGASGTAGENGWFKSVVSLGLSYTDGSGSGFGRYGLTTSNATTYNSSKEASQDNTAGTTWYGYVEDAAGNASSCSRTVKVDRTAPTCSVTFSGTAGNSGWYKAQNATVTLNRSDGGGGSISAYGLTTSTTATYNGSASASQGDTAGTTWRGYVKDSAGNVGSCSASVKVDKTAPSCSIGASGTAGENGWFRSVASLGLSYTDGSGSGMSRYGLATSTGVTYNSSASASQDNTAGTTWYGYVEDVAGNASSCSRSVKVDRTAPTCSIGVSGTAGNNGWYRVGNANLTLNRNDTGGSGLSNYGLTTSTSVTYNSSASSAQGDTGGTTWRGYVKDAAGNTGSCAVTVKVDKTNPTCSSSGGSDTWTNGSRTLTGTCADGLSGCTGNASRTFNSEGSWTNQSPGTVYDQAGNSVTCPGNQTVRIDKTPPTCSISVSGTGGNNGWYRNNNVTLTLNQSETGGSGVSGYGLTTSTSATYNGTASASQGDTSGVVWRGYIKDAAGNVGSCATGSFKVDKTPPSCTSSGGSDAWTNGNRTLTGTCADGLSGCVGNVSKGFTTDTNLANQTPGSVSDQAGNSASCPANQTVKIDKTAPNKPTINNPSGGNATPDPFALTVNSSDAGSGINYWQWRYAGEEWKTYSDSAKNTFVTGVFSMIRNEDVYIRACDYVGNCSSESSSRINIIAKKSGWKDEGTCRAYYENNARVKGFKTISGASYYFDANGCMQTGWVKDANINKNCKSKYWYFNPDAGGNKGKMITGWRKVGSKWYYMAKADGKETKWQSAQPKGCMYTGWVYSEDFGCATHGWYFYPAGVSGKSEGSMATDTKIGGSYVGTDGCWLENLYACRSASPDSYVVGNTFVHSEATLSSKQQMTIATGALVHKINETGDFYKVYVPTETSWTTSNPYWTNGRTGYMKKSCTQKSKPTSTSYCTRSACPG